MRRLLIGIGLVGVLFSLLTIPATAAPSSPAKPAAAAPLATVSIPARRIPASDFFLPTWIGGDREFDGHGPRVFASATLLVASKSLKVRLFMDAIETKSDFTHARGTSPDYLIFVPAAGQCIVSVSKGTYDELQYTDNDTTLDNFSGQVVGSFVKSYSVIGDTAGDDAGVDTGFHINTFTFSVTTQAC
jgi:hypothetical protein